MTIEVGIMTEGMEEKRVIVVAAPGETITFSDFSSGNREMIAVHCNPDDTGGIVFTLPNQEYVENSVVRAIPAELFTEENITHVIGAGGTFETDIVAETRQRGRLVLQHLMD